MEPWGQISTGGSGAWEKKWGGKVWDSKCKRPERIKGGSRSREDRLIKGVLSETKNGAGKGTRGRVFGKKNGKEGRAVYFQQQGGNPRCGRQVKKNWGVGKGNQQQEKQWNSHERKFETRGTYLKGERKEPRKGTKILEEVSLLV